MSGLRPGPRRRAAACGPAHGRGALGGAGELCESRKVDQLAAQSLRPATCRPLATVTHFRVGFLSGRARKRDDLIGPTRMSIYMGGTSKFMIPVSTRPPILSHNKETDQNFPMPIQDRFPNLKLRDFPSNHQPFLSARAPLPRPHNRSFNGYQVFEPYSWSLTRRYTLNFGRCML